MRRYVPHWWVPMLLLAGCASNPPLPQPPKTVTVTVHVHDPVPHELTDLPPKPVLKDTTIGGHTLHEFALEVWGDTLACRLGLIARAGDGKPVDPKACTPAEVRH